MAKSREVMTKDPVFCQPNDSITKIAGVMKQEDVGSVPVVESAESRKLVGIVTDRDIVVKIVAGGRAPDSATVRDAMTPNPVSCREDDDVDQSDFGQLQRCFTGDDPVPAVCIKAAS